MIGRALGHYDVLEKIGEGGMGVVYRAADRRLGRDVAIKVLPAAVAADPERLERFTREVRAVASLSHPQVVQIHDFDVQEGQPYAVMELLEGETLREEMLRTGPLPLERALGHARQIADGLAAAHDRGIVHRDLKPENVFVTRDGWTKILDFGLAKIALGRSPEEEHTLSLGAETVPGALIGTVAYMAPEQIRGEEATSRSDVFAFGVVVHEMLAGAHPFPGATPPERMSAILRDEAPRLAERVPGVPRELSRLVAECLSKEPGHRMVSARGLGARLEAVGVGPSTPSAEPDDEDHSRPGIDSLAVVPFRNESRDSDADYLIEGITDSLIDRLSRLPRLRVMARSTVFRLREAGSDPLEIGQSLGVRAILTGQLRQRRDVLSIRAELVDATDGTRLWGGRFDRPMTDLIAIENELSSEIADNLLFELSPREKEQLVKRSTVNPQAHEAYLQGRYVWSRWKTPDGMRTAIGFFERALEHDPLYALAFAGLADSFSVLGNVKAVPPDEAYPRAKTAAEQGLAIDDGLAELHTSLGFIQKNWDWDWDAAERSLLRAIELNPGYATAHRWYASLLSGLGRHDQAVTVVKRALELDPLSLIIHTTVGDCLFYARRYDEAMEYYRKTIEMDAQFLPGHTDLARALELTGRYDEAIAMYRKAETLAPKGPPDPSSGLAHVYARMGRREDALEILERLQELGRTRYVSPYGIASVYACLGEVETSLDWLEKAYAEHDQTLVWIKVHPRLDPVRPHPRYRALLERMAL